MNNNYCFARRHHLVGNFVAGSKSSLDAEMAALLSRLLGLVKVAVISGSNWAHFEKQLLANLPHDEHLKN